MGFWTPIFILNKYFIENIIEHIKQNLNQHSLYYVKVISYFFVSIEIGNINPVSTISDTSVVNINAMLEINLTAPTIRINGQLVGGNALDFMTETINQMFGFEV